VVGQRGGARWQRCLLRLGCKREQSECVYRHALSIVGALCSWDRACWRLRRLASCTSLRQRSAPQRSEDSFHEAGGDAAATRDGSAGHRSGAIWRPHRECSLGSHSGERALAGH
jgi:hypothetical protein